MKTFLTTAAALLIVSAAAPSAETKTASSHHVSDFKLGAHIDGPALTLADTKGKAVVIEAWGIHCGPCLASLPDMEKMARRYKDRMVVFGAHSQQGTDEEVKAVVKKNKLSYTITNGVNSPISFSGIPRVFVFDTTGALIFDGAPFDKDFDKAIRRSVQGGSSAGSAAKPSGLDALKRPGTN
jgi:thiol-disulfide isomerase/thioredoxin